VRSSAARVPFAALANLTVIIAVASFAQAVDVPAIPLDAQLALWLDAATITSPDGGPVAEWPDQSSTRVDASQGAADRQPLKISDAINGLPVVRFDGTDDRLDLASNLFANSSYPMTLFVVARTTSANAHVLGNGSSSAGFLSTYGSGLAILDDRATAKANRSGNGLLVFGSAGISDGVPHVLGARIQSTGSQVWSDCTPSAASSAGTNAYPYTRSTIGASDGSTSNASRDPFAGDIAEILVYNSALTLSDLAEVANYLSTKYAIDCEFLAPPSVPLGEDLALWLDAADITAAADGPVSDWPDRSFAANAASQSTVDRQPILITNALGSLPAVRFDGSNDRLDLFSNLFANSNYPLTLFVVATTTSENTHVLGTGSSGAGFLSTYGSGLALLDGRPTVKTINNGSGLLLRSGTVAAGANPRVLTARIVNGDSTIWTNCAESRSYSAATNAYPYTRSTIGASDGSGSNGSRDALDGDVAEIIVYGRALSNDEIDEVSDYLSAKYLLECEPVGNREPSLSDGLRMFWRLEEAGSETRVDWVSGQQIHPFPADGIGLPTGPGKIGLGAHVNGPDNYHFWSPSAPRMNTHGGSLTVSGWVRFDSFYDSQTVIAKWDLNAQPQKQFRLWYNNDTRQFQFDVSGNGLDGPGNAQSVHHAMTPVVDEFYLVEGWYDAEAGEIGIRVSTSTERLPAVTAPWSGGVHFSSADLNVAAHNTCRTAHLDGTIDAVGFWGRALSTEESSGLWNSGDGVEPGFDDVGNAEDVGCNGVPGSDRAVDSCGVCGGNGTRCVDPPLAVDGLRVWLRATDVFSAIGESVTFWADASGIRNDASQTDFSDAPILVSSTGNGLLAVRFDGVDDRLDLPTNVFSRSGPL
jgi:hypothetical protein